MICDNKTINLNAYFGDKINFYRNGKKCSYLAIRIFYYYYDEIE